MRVDWSRSLVAAVLGVLLAVVLTGCGGGGPSASSTVSASPSVSVSPSPTKPAVPPQPKGKHGVTYHIINWAKYANDPVVLAWKTVSELFAASTNTKHVVPGLIAHSTKAEMRESLSELRSSWEKGLQFKPRGEVRIRSVHSTANGATVVACLWGPSTGYYQSNGKYYGKREVFWFRQKAVMKKQGGAWRLASLTYPGRCKGGAPK